MTTACPIFDFACITDFIPTFSGRLYKAGSKCEPGRGGICSLELFDPTNMTCSPIPNVSIAVPTKNMSATSINRCTRWAWPECCETA
nr:hypothetical protein Iba_chr14dCG19810 [Ipomoea batatas]